MKAVQYCMNMTEFLQYPDIFLLLQQWRKTWSLEVEFPRVRTELHFLSTRR